MLEPVEDELCLLEVPEMIRCVLLCMLEAVKGILCLLEGLETLEVPEVPEMTRCMPLCMLETAEGGVRRC